MGRAKKKAVVSSQKVTLPFASATLAIGHSPFRVHSRVSPDGALCSIRANTKGSWIEGRLTVVREGEDLARGNEFRSKGRKIGRPNRYPFL